MKSLTMVNIAKSFKYCPNCRSDKLSFLEGKCFECNDCGWVYYHNMATAVGAIIKKDNKILFLERNMNPKKNFLDFPGGFVDRNEPAEEALKREIFEELGVKVKKMEYFLSATNRYYYRGINYNTCDLYFFVELDNVNFNLEKKEVKKAFFIDLKKIKMDQLAFKSAKKIVKKLKQK